MFIAPKISSEFNSKDLFIRARAQLGQKCGQTDGKNKKTDLR
jgi:hypothetical protein